MGLNHGLGVQQAASTSECHQTAVGTSGRCGRSPRSPHFATFPPKLIEPCVLAGCPEGGTVLDPFSGAGTTGLVALRNGRSYVGIELNPEYAQMARERLEMDVRLGHRPPVAGPAPIDGQVSMLDLLGEATA
jgi:hypothetical protein